MMQLDDDILEAMKKFEQMEEVLNSLPGLDCGACGAPNCQCLAEDIVQGKATEIDCIFKLRASVKKLAHGMLDMQAEVTGGYASDLLSNVMGQAEPGMVWVTMQGHQNVAAVASLIGLAAVVVAGGAPVEEETLKKADANNINIAVTDLPAYVVAGQLYALGITNGK